MKEAVVVSAVRTAVGKAPKGTLRFSRPDDLGRDCGEGGGGSGAGAGCERRLRM